MNYYPHHIGDYAAATEHLTWIEDMAYTRLLRVYYRTERPLPADVAACCRLIRATLKAERLAVQSVLAEFFVLTDDGHRQKRCDEEIAAFQDKAAKASRSAASRWKDKQNPTEPCERNANAMRTQSEGNATLECERNANHNHNQNQSSAIPPVDNSTGAGRTSAALRALGVDVTPANPLLLAWVAAGVTEKQLAEAVERARLHKPKPARVPAAYLDPIVREVIAGPPAPAARASPAWWTTEAETTAKGKELGLYPRGGESWDAFRGRIRAAINQGVAHAS